MSTYTSVTPLRRNCWARGHYLHDHRESRVQVLVRPAGFEPATSRFERRLCRDHDLHPFAFTSKRERLRAFSNREGMRDELPEIDLAGRHEA